MLYIRSLLSEPELVIAESKLVIFFLLPGVVVSVSPRARIKAKLSPAIREAKMYFQHAEEDDGPS